MNKTLFGKIESALGLAGIDLPRMSGVRHARRFLEERNAFLKQGGKIDMLKPILFDYDDQSGAANGHYFHQDLLVAQFIHDASPLNHLDIASRIDGFVAHVAAFREIEVIDVRPLEIDEHPRIRFLQADLMQPQPSMRHQYSSVSCLHALEHFGLGRYGDPVAPDGHLTGFKAILDLVAPGGVLYISFPIGDKRVEFNAQRVFDPREITSWIINLADIERFDFVDDQGRLHKEASIKDAEDLHYGCGIYTLRIN